MAKDLDTLLARLRDFCDNASTEISEYLAGRTKQVLKQYDMSKIKYEEKEGAKGKYRLATKAMNPDNADFNACLVDLKSRDGKPLRHQKMFIWLIGEEGDRFGFKPVAPTVKKPEAVEEPLVPPVPAKVASAQTTTSALKSIVDVSNLFPKDLADMVLFEQTETYITIKPRQYLGSENFAKIAAIVRDQNGEYVSAGKESHFRIPRS